MNDTLTFTSSVLAPNSPKRKELGPAKITSSFICYVTLPAYPLLFFRFTFVKIFSPIYYPILYPDLSETGWRYLGHLG